MKEDKKLRKDTIDSVYESLIDSTMIEQNKDFKLADYERFNGFMTEAALIVSKEEAVEFLKEQVVQLNTNEARRLLNAIIHLTEK